jgi:hypothetical protein
VALIIVGLIGSGCARFPMLDHQVGAGPAALRAKWDTVFTPWSWQPMRLPGTNPATAPAYPFPPAGMEYQQAQVEVIKGEWVGFGRKDGQLIAFAGPSKWMLDDGHYRWTSREYDNRIRNVGDAAGRALGFVLTATAIAAVLVGAAWLEAHEPEHKHCY